METQADTLREHELDDRHEAEAEGTRLDGHEKRLAEHHDRLTVLEKACGIHKEPDDMRSETERHADERHEGRQRRDEHLARRKRS